MGSCQSGYPKYIKVINIAVVVMAGYKVFDFSILISKIRWLAKVGFCDNILTKTRRHWETWLGTLTMKECSVNYIYL